MLTLLDLKLSMSRKRERDNGDGAQCPLKHQAVNDPAVSIVRKYRFESNKFMKFPNYPQLHRTYENISLHMQIYRL